MPHATEENASAKEAHHPVVLLSPGALRGQQWNHVAVVHDGLQASVWINGIQECSARLPVALQTPAVAPTSMVDARLQAMELAKLPIHELRQSLQRLCGSLGTPAVTDPTDSKHVLVAATSHDSNKLKSLSSLGRAPVKISGGSSLKAALPIGSDGIVGLPQALLGAGTGKWYFEVRITPHSDSGTDNAPNLAVGLVQSGSTLETAEGQTQLGGPGVWAVQFGNSKAACQAVAEGSGRQYGSPLGGERILSVAIDADRDG